MPTATEIATFLATEFPQTKCRVVAVGGRSATLRHEVGIDELRPGGTVSGPVMMEVADAVLYVAILGEIGIVPLTVTTSLNINFLRKPGQKDILAEGRILKLGQRLAVGEVLLYTEGEAEPVAHVTGTYSIPPRR